MGQSRMTAPTQTGPNTPSPARGIGSHALPPVPEDFGLPSSPDRRQARRAMTVLRVAKLESGDMEDLAIIRNVSEGGICLFTDQELGIGAQVSISLIEDIDIEGRVVWARDRFIGVAFDGDVPVGDLLARPQMMKDGRRARFPRLSVDARVDISVNNQTTVARVRDVSHKGAKLLFQDPVARSTQGLVVIIDEATRLEAMIRWQSGALIGVEFLKPISPHLLSHLIGMLKARQS
jgi:hypothetical protein